MRKIILFTYLLFSFSANAYCPLADRFIKQGNEQAALSFLTNCAINYNDDESQMKLARAYVRGEFGLEKDPNQSLYYYQLSAENGNAEAQVAVAESLIRATKSPKAMERLLKHYINVSPTSDDSFVKRFDDFFMHPYALLKLASESPDKKWYYPSLVRSAPAKTLTLLRNYEIPEDVKKEAMKQASQFKIRKLLQTAREVLSSDEYPDMEKRLKSPQTQKQAMEELKKKMEEYIQRKKDSRKTK
ncbi:MAG: sel1 repeat family protein [Alphaproteobacteria bacterium]|nr:sel1 repeat family protein [Alphaproteobacteria bacterium]